MDRIFESVVSIMPRRIAAPIGLCRASGADITEIRLRANLPLCVTVSGQNRFVSCDGRLTEFPESTCVICDALDVSDVFSAACEYSVYTYEQQIADGFITMKSGCRVGVCGAAAVSSGRVTSIKNVTSLNIRIAAEHKFCASKIIDDYRKNGVRNTVIVGAPGSGKTTVLRDAARQLSSGRAGAMKRVCAVDERGELFSCAENFDRGLMTDVLAGVPKAQGIINAVRTLSPEVIVFDEIGTSDELAAIAQSFDAGANVITTIHAGSISELCRRKIGRDLLCGGEFSLIVLLSPCPGGEMTLYDAKDISL